MKNVLTATVVLIALSFSGCSQKSVEGGTTGAAMGAVGASLVGALTDLIINGQVNPARLQRNMVSGAIAGGATGAIVGSHSNKVEKVAKKESNSDKALKSEIGKTNYVGLEYLVNCKHEDAYRMAIESTKSSNIDYKLSGYALQALTDKDRSNESGMLQAMNSFIKLDKQITTLDVAKTELNKLYVKLQDERRILGQSTTCK
ncbi:MAG: hypothetical protein GQ570_07415 [Helicobacteraceae bacterium]|nr:hypothetical protein [Helicobacteraceae bacterium]